MLLRNGITVIVPTYNRRDLLDKTLLSLCFQSFNVHQYEVIVVDDGSSDDTKDIVLSFKDRMFISYFYQEDKGFRVAKARNIGIINAHFSVCLFFDSGMIAHPKLLENHWYAHQGKSTQALIGFAYGYCDFEGVSQSLLQDFSNRETVEKIFDTFRVNQYLRDRRQVAMDNAALSFEDITIPWIIFWTCHISCSTKSLLSVGGFDESFQSWGGEDIELGIRLHKTGISFAFADGCEAIHWPHDRTLINAGAGTSYTHYVYKKHPELATSMLLDPLIPWVEIVKTVGAQTADNSCVTKKS